MYGEQLIESVIIIEEVSRVGKKSDIGIHCWCAEIWKQTVQTSGRQPEITLGMSKKRTLIGLGLLASKT